MLAIEESIHELVEYDPYEESIHELVQFNPNYHPSEPVDMLLSDIVEAFKESVELRVLLETIILNKESE